ncbi:hypothetical protein BGHDH14_bghG003477000001001 [Blumeria hordei DH14]|uniref:Uncharacterized protein n=1 Tax=Blumeria graminis f. sp. hordei (strain DH14) TaxID=546991 RepID=N1JAT0_BLUG1|nr:hypothetical protein BGHDH14_bghG003477000001001 [Blumeria hordei DH14]
MMKFQRPPRHRSHARRDASEEPAEILDEQEQEALIVALQRQHLAQNRRAARALSVLPLLSLIAYIPTLLVRATAWLSLLAISSLLATAYLLLVLPFDHPTGLSMLTPSLHPRPRSSRSPRPPYLGPVLQHLPALNLGLVLILAVAGNLARRRIPSLWLGFGWLPAAIYAFVALFLWLMGSVNPEKELSRLRYQCKGA